MRGLWLLAAGLAAITAGSAVWVRVAPSNPAVWHVDPLTAPPTGRVNAWRVGPEATPGVDVVAPIYPASASELAAALDATAMSEPGTQQLGGAPEALWTTYVQRSPWMKFPDYVSVKTIDLGNGRGTLAIYSRARFGRDDLGVNRARVERWMAALTPFAG